MSTIWMDVDAALAEVPVNVAPLISDSDFKTVDEGIAYNESNMALYWHFTTTAGATTVTAVTPTTSGLHDWAHQDHGMYAIEIPTASGDINNTEEGFGYFTGVCDAVLPWRGPTIGFRAAAINNLMIDDADLLTEVMFNDIVYVDDSGTAGTTWPTGLAFQPTTTVASGKDIADAINIRRLHIHGSHTLGEAMEHWAFIADGHIDTGDLFTLGGQSVEHSTFAGMIITGAMGSTKGVANACQAIDSAVYAVTDMNALVRNGSISGACSILDDGWFEAVDCNFGSLLACTLTVQGLGAGSHLHIHGMGGELTLAGMTEGSAQIDMKAGAVLIIDNTCSAGALTVTGDGTVTGTGTGTFALTITKPVANAVQLAGGTQSLTDLKDFADTGYNPETHAANADMIMIHGSNLTETPGQLAGRFVNFFDQSAAAYNVKTALADFKATGFATPTNITAGTITTVTTLSNLPACPADWLDAAGIKTGAFSADAFAADALVAATFAASSLDGKGDWSTVVPDAAGVVATALGNLETHGDSTWATATGFSTHTAANVLTEFGTGSTLTDCATATGFNTTVPDAAGVVATALGLLETHGDSDWKTATGFSTHAAADVYTAFGTGANLTTCATATSTTCSDKTGFSVSQTGLDAVLKTTTFALAMADATWDEAIAGHATGTTFGGKNQKVVPSETIDDYKAIGFSTHNAAAVWTTGSRALSTPADYKADVSALALEASLSDGSVTLHSDYDAAKTAYTGTPPTADAITTAVWAAGTRTLTSFGSLVADIATAVWAATTRTLTAFGFTVVTDAASRTASKATGFSTHTAAAVKTEMEADGSKLDHLWEMTEDDDGTRRLTENALEEAPAGGGATAEEVRIEMDSNSTQFAAIVEDTNELQTDWLNGGRLDNLLDTAASRGSSSTGEGAYTGTLIVDDGEGNGLAGAVVVARRSGIVKASGTTDDDGQITDWVFDAYTYDLAVRLDSYQPTTDTLAVSADDWEKTISLSAMSITSPSAISLCTVQFRVMLSATAVEGAVCKAKLQGINQASDGTLLSNEELSSTTSALGVAELQLVRKDSIVKGNGIYKIWVEIAGKPVASVETTIPGQSVILFEDLL